MANGYDFQGQEIDEYLEEIERRRASRAAAAASAVSVVSDPAAREGARAVKHKRGVGSFVIPKYNIWAAHRELVLDPHLKLRYSSLNYPHFDDIIHQNASYRPVWDKEDGRFAAYDVLRENLAVLRNYLMSEFFPDGSVDAEDELKVKHMEQIAQVLVTGMNNDALLSNPLKNSISVERANLPGTGAQYLYQKIMEKQHRPSWISPLLTPIYWITGMQRNDWGLPPLNASPFSDAALRMPPPVEEAPLAEEDIQLLEAAARSDRDPRATAQAQAENINHIADDIALSGLPYNSIDTLREPTRGEAVELARKILRNLKITMGQNLLENGLLPPGSDNNSDFLDALSGAVKFFESSLKTLMGLDPKIMNNPSIIAANTAIGMLAYAAKRDVLRLAEKSGNKQLKRTVSKQIDEMPASWKDIRGKTVGQALEAVESGMDTVLTRLNQVADRDTSTQYWLGFSNANALGAQDPAMKQAADSKPKKAMEDTEYNRQYNAQRAQNQQQQQAAFMGRQRTDTATTGPNASGRTPNKQQAAKPAPSTSSLGTLLAKDQMASMRQTMAYDPKMAAVETNNRQNVMKRLKAQRDKQAKINEEINRSNDRNAQRLDAQHHAQDLQPQPAAHKKQPRSSHGF